MKSKKLKNSRRSILDRCNRLGFKILPWIHIRWYHTMHVVFGEDKTALIDNNAHHEKPENNGKIDDAFEQEGKRCSNRLHKKPCRKPIIVGISRPPIKRFPEAPIYCSGNSCWGIRKKTLPFTKNQFQTVGNR